MTIEQFEVRNYWTNAVQFTATIEVTPDMTARVKLGLAVKWGRANDADLRYADLRYAAMSHADLRYADLSYADLRYADMSDADLSDADLRYADLRYADMSDADLRYAAMSHADLRYVNLSYADLSYADLRYADMSDADLSHADLRYADLSYADLRYADMSDAPIIPNIHQQVYAAASQPGALNMRFWHTCDTTHCRAGWVVALAGEEGKALEGRIGTPAAASLIYLASDPGLGKFPSFYCDDDTALADMKDRAEQEAAKAGAV